MHSVQRGRRTKPDGARTRPSWPQWTRGFFSALAVGLALLGGAKPTDAQPAAIAPSAQGSPRDASLTAEPGERSDWLRPITSPRPVGIQALGLQDLWRQGIHLERRGLFLESAAVHQQLASRAPDLAYAYWKVARSYWRFAESLPTDAKDLRLPYFELAHAWATRGLDADADCAECMLWKFGAMGRIGTTRGVVRSLRMAPEMRDLIERGIALRPTYRDDSMNSTLGNLYYAGSVFYRVVPDWRWLEWLSGVRGDMDRSLEMIRQAVALDGDRIDYQVELGAVLLCYADRNDDAGARSEARRLLRRVPEMPRRIATDQVDTANAALLLDDPTLGCGYSRDGWIDIENERRAARQ